MQDYKKWGEEEKEQTFFILVLATKKNDKIHLDCFKGLCPVQLCASEALIPSTVPCNLSISNTYFLWVETHDNPEIKRKEEEFSPRD